MSIPSPRRRAVLADLTRVLRTVDGPLLDVGGSRARRESATHAVGVVSGGAVVLNMTSDARPDVLGDAHRLPFGNGSFRTVVMAETLEHLRDPLRAAREVHRVLVADGRLIATVPFAFRVHGDPDDYQRLTPSGLRRTFAGFEIERLEPQGGPWSVIACILRDLLVGARPWWLPRRIAGLLGRVTSALARLDRRGRIRRASMLSGWTTGYLIVARRAGSEVR